jgi:hypothetical protein
MSISPIATTSSENIYFPSPSHTENISNQETNLQTRIKSVASRMAYKTYSFFHHPGTLPPERVAEALYEENKKKILGEKPKSYEERKADFFPATDKSHLTKLSIVEIYEDPDFYKLIGPYSDPEFRKKAELYADPEYRKTQARKHIEKPLQIEQKEEWYVLSFCKEELHVIYEQEPEHLRKYIANDIWMLNRYNREALANPSF